MKMYFLFIGLFMYQILLSQSQKVGIGTITPTNMLSVVGNANFTGNVGIGTSVPGKLLQVEGDARINVLNLGRGGGSIITNTAFGYNALAVSNLTGLNTAMGNSTMTFNSNGANNVAYGSQGLVNNTNGNSNTAVGKDALLHNATGSMNTAIGYAAGVSNFNFSNATAIGANATASTSNSLILGNNANVGIGTSSPTAKLEVAGTTTTESLQMTTGATDNFVLKSDGAGNASWVNMNSVEQDPQVTSSMINRVAKWNGSSIADGQLHDDGTRIGVGMTSPSAGLDIRAANIGLRLWSGSTTAGSLTSYQIGRIITDGTLGVASATGEYATDAVASNLIMRNELLSRKLILNAGSGPATFVVTNNKVGIGTTTPVNTLDVEGEMAVGSGYSGTHTAHTDGAIIEGNVGIGTATPLSRLHMAGNIAKTDSNINHVAYVTSNEEPLSNPFGIEITLKGDPDIANRNVSIQTMDYGLTNGGILAMENAAGSVGIATSTPVTTLDVQGAIRTKYSGVILKTLPVNLGVIYEADCTISPLPADWDFANSVIFVTNTGGQQVEIHKIQIIDSNTVRLSIKYFSTDSTWAVFAWVAFRT